VVESGSGADLSAGRFASRTQGRMHLSGGGGRKCSAGGRMHPLLREQFSKFSLDILGPRSRLRIER
jgi:hypothetical protein